MIDEEVEQMKCLKIVLTDVEDVLDHPSLSQVHLKFALPSFLDISCLNPNADRNKRIAEAKCLTDIPVVDWEIENIVRGFGFDSTHEALNEAMKLLCAYDVDFLKSKKRSWITGEDIPFRHWVWENK